jgi:hypothetical protein
MSAEQSPTGRESLRLLRIIFLVLFSVGLLAVVYRLAWGRESGEQGQLGAGGFIFLILATVVGVVHKVLLGLQTRIEALEKHAAADANRTVVIDGPRK